MSRRHGDVVQVRTGSGTGSGTGADVPGADLAPEQFLWRGRLYVVRAVLAHWIEVGAWWRSAARVLDDRSGAPSLPAGGGQGRPGAAAGGPGQPGGLPDPVERQVWRVEASAGRSADLGVYDLACDATGRCWQLARALD